ncbi:MAG: tetratricopeptide repeat protein [Parvularculaceae bacterium]|nr:tetratricopeptide repeat protein [Parvularculaceae bacterium]
MNPAPTSKLQEAAGWLQRGEPARAHAIAAALVAANPQDAEAQHLLALALSHSGEARGAAAAFEAAAALHPRKDVILVNLGNHWRRAGDLGAAADAYERAALLSPAPAEALAALGGVRAQSGDPEAALSAFSRALAADPRNAAALNGLGNLAAGRGDHGDAADYFTSAIAAAPQSFVAYVNRGAALRNLGRLEEALADLDRGAALAPRSAEAAYQRAAALRVLGRFDDAAAGYRAALAIAPARTDIHREFAGMMFEAGREGEAFSALDAVLARAPSAGLLVTRGELSLLFGDAAAARASGARAIALAPMDAGAFGLAAKAARQQNDLEEALQAARRAVDLGPDDFALLHTCCEIELATGRAADAARRLDRPAPPAHLQKHIALKATAMRASGDPGYRRYFDYDRLTAQIAIDPPADYSSIEEFNRALLTAIEPLHRTRQRPLDQTLYGGTQSPGRLWNRPDPVIKLFAGMMLAAARRFVAGLPDDPAHPFLSRKSDQLRCAGAWSVILASGGGHVDHIHPAGWISASYYVDSPPEIFAGDRAGFLRLGAAGVPGLSLPAERYFPPTPGTAVFFPSYIWHGVEPFSAPRPRVTAPFDLAPASD